VILIRGVETLSHARTGGWKVRRSKSVGLISDRQISLTCGLLSVRRVLIGSTQLMRELAVTPGSRKPKVEAETE
jgi:hypothetical protein